MVRRDGGRIRALHVGKYIPPPEAGIESHTDSLLRCLQSQVDCTLLAAESPMGGPTADVPYQIRAVASYGKFNSVFLSPGILRQARDAFRANDVDLVHIHAPNPWGDLVALLAPASLPVVMTWHSDIVRQRILYQGYRLIQRAAIARASRIIVPTPMHLTGSTQLTASAVSDRISVVPYGIDTDALDSQGIDHDTTADIAYWAAGRPVVLTVGRHVYYKGYEYLLQSLPMMRSAAVLIMIGAGPLTPTLRSQIERLGISDRVTLWGHVPRAKLLAAMHACDVFALPSVEPAEAFGIASAEAMACGKPVVACALGNGVDYLHDNGRTGLLVPPRDPAALAQALDHLCFDPTLRQQMGMCAKERIRQHFSLQAMTQATLDVYHQVLRQHHPSFC